MSTKFKDGLTSGGTLIAKSDITLGDYSAGAGPNGESQGSIILGVGSDLTITTDSDQGVIRQTTASKDMFIQPANGKGIIISESGQNTGHRIAEFIQGGAVNLYHNETLKLATDSSGVTIDGDVVAKKYTFPQESPSTTNALTGTTGADDSAFITVEKTSGGTPQTTLDFVVTDNANNNDGFRFRFDSTVDSNINSGNIYDLITIKPDAKGCTIMDLTVSHDQHSDNNATDNVSEIKAAKFTGQASTVAALTGLNTNDLTQGTNNKYFANILAHAAFTAGTGISLTSDNATPPVVTIANTAVTPPTKVVSKSIHGSDITSGNQLTMSADFSSEIKAGMLVEFITSRIPANTTVTTVTGATVTLSADLTGSGIPANAVVHFFQVGTAAFDRSDFSVNSTTGKVSLNDIHNFHISATAGIALSKLAKGAGASGTNSNATIPKGFLLGNTAATDTATGTVSAIDNVALRTMLGIGGDGADKYGSWTVSDGIGNKNIASGKTLKFAITSGASRGVAITEPANDGNIVCTITQTDAVNTYSAEGANVNDNAGIFLDGATVFKLSQNIRPTANLQVGSSNVNGSYASFRNGGNIDFYQDSTNIMARLQSCSQNEINTSADKGLLVAGNITAYSSALSSDIKLKEDIVVVDNALEVLSKIDGVRFNWKDSGKASSGVIAQNIEEVLPELVRETETLNSDNDTHKVVDYNGLSAYFIEAIKELKEQNDLLRAEIEELKANK